MTSLCDEVRRRVPPECITRDCEKECCSVDMTDVPDDHVLIDVDKAGLSGNQRKCDYIFVGCNEDTWVVAMELKRGNPRASTVVEQLRAGAEYADSIIPKGAGIRFLPVVVTGKIKPEELSKLRREENMVCFRGDSSNVVHRYCGDQMVSVLKRRLEEER